MRPLTWTIIRSRAGNTGCTSRSRYKCVPFRYSFCSSCYSIGSFSKLSGTITTSSIGFSLIKNCCYGRTIRLPFQFKERSYTVVVSIAECEGKRTAIIHLPDASLHPILKGSTFSFDAEKGMQVDHPAQTPMQDLLASILGALDQYVQESRTMDLETRTF